MVGKKNEEKRLYWQEMIGRQADSGLSVRQFCVAEGISEPSFYAWRRKLSQPKVEEKRSATSIGGRSVPRNGRGFIPLELLEAPGAVEVVHPSGYRIRVTGDVSAAALRNVIEVLDERGER